jgi:monofunctional biosynthetic peptidoglycan transglycosylase
MILLTMMLTMTLDMTAEPWRAVNDGVMGGISAGRMVETETGLSFEGELSLENNGGFASVRRLVGQDLSGAGRVRIEVRGDGRSYQARFRQDGRFDGVAWRAVFETSGSWQTLELAFSAFEPVFRGRRVPQAGPLVAADIRQFGFMLADGKPGPFRLEIRSIEFLPGAAAATTLAGH